MSRTGIKNSRSSRLLHRKSALRIREANLKTWNQTLTAYQAVPETAPERIDNCKKKIDLCQAEIATLKKRMQTNV